MQIIGSDFTSDPKPGKPITVADCIAEHGVLTVTAMKQFVNFQSFALLLSSDGPWVIGLDFPFGQPERIINDLNWPRNWADYVRHVAALGKKKFRTQIDLYRKGQLKGDMEHFRDVDIKADSISPMKMYRTPVGIMFCEGSPFLLASPASVLPFLPQRDPARIILEAYPKLVATKVVGKSGYKTDNKKKVTTEQKNVRKRIIASICDNSDSSSIKRQYGFHVRCSDAVVQSCTDDPSGDTLDAVLCAIQAAWAWSRANGDYGIPSSVNVLEGWIADPKLFTEQRIGR